MTTMNEFYYNNSVIDNHRVPEWIRSERYEFCEDFFENYTSDKNSFFARLASVLTSLFV